MNTCNILFSARVRVNRMCIVCSEREGDEWFTSSSVDG